MFSKQKRLPGTEELRVPELDEAVDAYQKAKEKLRKARELKNTTEQKVRDLMHSHQLTVYKNDDHVIELNEREESLKVKYRTTDPLDDNDDEGDEGDEGDE